MSSGRRLLGSVLLGIALGATRCREPPQATRAAGNPVPAATAHLVRLLDQLRGGDLTRDAPSAQPAVAAEGAARLLVREEFEGVPDPAGGARRRLPEDWVSGAGLNARTAGSAADLSAGAIWTADPRDGTSTAFVRREAAGLIRDLALGPNGSVLVVARVRAAVAGATNAGLFVSALAEFHAPVPPAGTANQKMRVAVMTRARTPFEAKLDPEQEDRWQELAVYVPPLPGRRGLRLALQAAEGGLFVDRVEVRAVAPWEVALSEQRAHDDGSTLPWRRILRRGDERADSLLLTAGSEAGFDVTIPATRPRLEFLAATFAAPDSGPLRLSVRVDGREIAAHDFAAAQDGKPTPFVPITIALEACAGRPVHLTLAAAGPPESALMIGAPLLLGTPAGAIRRNLLLISIDTLRSDQLGCYGARPSLTPNIDRLAEEGTRFAGSLSASAWTLPSHATLFTGQPPPVHGAVTAARRVDPRRSPLLAPLLAAQGYVTAAFTGGGFLDPAYGLASGFDRYSTRDPAKAGGDPAKPVGAAQGRRDDPLVPVLDWLADHADQPFFLFVHTYLVHDYAPDDEFLARARGAAGAAPAPAASPAAKSASVRKARLLQELRAGDLTRLPELKALYAAALMQADEQLVGRILERLAALGLDETTVVAFVSDHGDQWFEHGGWLHRPPELWSELVQVPLILRGPGVPAGAVVTSAAGHVDVGPTLLHEIGFVPPETMLGRDLLGPPADEERVQLLHAVVEGDDAQQTLEGLLAGPWKLLRRRRTLADTDPVFALFRRDLDPHDEQDLAATEPARVRELARRLDRELAACEALARRLGSTEESSVELPDELRHELRELGYLGD